MTNSPDPKTKTPRTTEALAKLIRWEARSDAATLRGSHLDSDDPTPPDGWEFAATLELENQSLARQNETLRNAQKACGDCDAPTLAEFRALTRRLEEAEKWKSAAIERQQRVDALEAKVDDQAEIIKFGSEECDRLNARITEAAKWRAEDNATILRLVEERDQLCAKLTALRTAAEAAMKALELANVTDEKFNEKNADFIEAALAALRAELEGKQ